MTTQTFGGKAKRRPGSIPSGPGKGKFPITGQKSVESAAKLIGHAKGVSKKRVAKHIITAAKAKGLKIPPSVKAKVRGDTKMTVRVKARDIDLDWKAFDAARGHHPRISHVMHGEKKIGHVQPSVNRPGMWVSRPARGLPAVHDTQANAEARVRKVHAMREAAPSGPKLQFTKEQKVAAAKRDLRRQVSSRTKRAPKIKNPNAGGLPGRATAASIDKRSRNSNPAIYRLPK